MPAYTTVDVAAVGERAHTKPIVKSADGGGAALEFAEVLKIEDSRGLNPSRAFVSVRNLSANDEAIPNVTLATSSELAPDQLKFFSRITIEAEGQPIFIGNLVRRRDFGTRNAVLLEYWDDRILLRGIPVRGALVYDSYADEIKFLPRYICRVNPFGFRNMTLAPLPGGDGTVPVFTQYAERATKANDGGNDPVDDTPGVANFWTPSFFLQYLKIFSSFDPGTFYPEFKNLDASKLDWDASVNVFTDPDMSRKMPDMTFTGKSLLRVIADTLDIAGNLDLVLSMVDGSTSQLQFAGRTIKNSFQQQTIRLQRTGAASSVLTAFDFTVERDASQLSTSVLVEGATPKIEAEYTYVPGGNANTLEPAWSSEEEEEFLKILDDDGNGNASILAKSRDFGGARLSMDGTGGRPTILAGTQEALHLARQQMPAVFRVYQLLSDPNSGDQARIETIMAGKDGIYTQAPFIIGSRAILPQQLQPTFEKGLNQRGRLRMAVRVQVDKDGTGAEYHDVTANTGLKITATGEIFLDGLTDEHGSDDLVYDGTLLDGNHRSAKKRALKINAAVQHDTRVKNSQELADGDRDFNRIYDQIDETMLDPQSRLGLQHYVLSPDSFREEQQVLSNPSFASSFPAVDGQGGSDTAPLTRILHSEDQQIEAHAKRRLKDKARITGAETWNMVGIRPEFWAGSFIEKVDLDGQDEFLVNRPVSRVVHDFTKQATSIITE